MSPFANFLCFVGCCVAAMALCLIEALYPLSLALVIVLTFAMGFFFARAERGAQ